MRPFRPLRDGSPPVALPALLRGTHPFGLAPRLGPWSAPGVGCEVKNVLSKKRAAAP
jgi:hypothetical protein